MIHREVHRRVTKPVVGDVAFIVFVMIFNKLLRGIFRVVSGDREIESLDALIVIAVVAGIYDTDEIAVGVEQAAAGVTAVDGGIRLHKRHRSDLVDCDFALGCGHDAFGDRAAEYTERVAYLQRLRCQP